MSQTQLLQMLLGVLATGGRRPAPDSDSDSDSKSKRKAKRRAGGDTAPVADKTKPTKLFVMCRNSALLDTIKEHIKDHPEELSVLKGRKQETVLHTAVRAGYTNLVSYLLDNHQDTVPPLKVNARGYSILHLAVASNSLPLVRLIITRPQLCEALINLRTIQFEKLATLLTPLAMACCLEGFPTTHLIAELLSVPQCDPNIPLQKIIIKQDGTETSSTFPLLSYTAAQGNSAALSVLLSCPRVDKAVFATPGHASPLLAALLSRKGNFADSIMIMLRHGLNPHALDDDGDSFYSTLSKVVDKFDAGPQAPDFVRAWQRLKDDVDCLLKINGAHAPTLPPADRSPTPASAPAAVAETTL